MEIRDKVVIITGAGPGMGQAMCRGAAAESSRVLFEKRRDLVPAPATGGEPWSRGDRDDARHLDQDRGNTRLVGPAQAEAVEPPRAHATTTPWSAAMIFSGVAGRSWIQTPVASWIAATTAGAAQAAGAMPIFTLYAIPHRDCGSYAAGGFGSAAGYREWIDSIAAGLRPTRSNR